MISFMTNNSRSTTQATGNSSLRSIVNELNEINDSINDFECGFKYIFHEYDNGDDTIAGKDDNDLNDLAHCNNFDQQGHEDSVETDINTKTYTKAVDLNVNRRCHAAINSMLSKSISAENSSILNTNNYAISILAEDVCFT